MELHQRLGDFVTGNEGVSFESSLGKGVMIVKEA